MKKKGISRRKSEKSHSSNKKGFKGKEKTKGFINKPKKARKGKNNSNNKEKYFHCNE